MNSQAGGTSGRKLTQEQIEALRVKPKPMEVCRPEGDCAYCMAMGGAGCDCPECHPAKHPTLKTEYDKLKRFSDGIQPVVMELADQNEKLKAERDAWKKVAEEKHGVHAADAFMERNEANRKRDQLRAALEEAAKDIERIDAGEEWQETADALDKIDKALRRKK